MIWLAVIVFVVLVSWHFLTRVPEGYELRRVLKKVLGSLETRVAVYDENGRHVGTPIAIPGFKYVAAAALARRHAKYGGE